MLPQKIHLKRQFQQINVKNHCFCLTKYVTHNYLMSQIYMIIFIYAF